MYNILKTFARKVGCYNKKYVWKYKTLFGEDTMTQRIDYEIYDEFVKRWESISVALNMLEDYIARVDTITNSKVLYLENRDKIIQVFLNSKENCLESMYVMLKEKGKIYLASSNGELVNINETKDLLKSTNMLIELL